jgi:hypothetical protein
VGGAIFRAGWSGHCRGMETAARAVNSGPVPMRHLSSSSLIFA